ncbi:MAG: ATP-dependent DNA ligase [Actinomycetota bacterium]|nr:ATP-dependent DNA ligase [Actinomycetota bacterium]
MQVEPSLTTVVAASAAVAGTRSRRAKVALLADALASIDPAERPIAVSYLAGKPRQDRLGVGWATVAAIDVDAAAEPMLLLGTVDATLASVATASGPGSTARRRELLDGLFAAATEDEQEFLKRLLMRELRQGSTAGLMVEAVAVASATPPALVRRATMVSGDLVEAASIAFDGGEDGLEAVRLRVLRPIQPMLAQTGDSLEAVFPTDQPMSVEAKLDGARIQVHRYRGHTRLFTRNLNDVTDRLPEIVTQVDALSVDAVILDGEAIALGATARPLPFQATMSRFGSSLDTETERTRRPLAPRFFDIIHLDGEDLLDRPLGDRLAALDTLPGELLVDRVVTADLAEATAFTQQALDAGHEGVMVKRLDAAYEAGMRGGAWLKVKPVRTLDLVVLAVEWGSGRRQGWLSNLHLGARDPDGGFVMLGKTFKGLTDAMLTWQTEHLLGLETGRRGNVVEVRPELVVEIALDGVQTSSRYPGGVALRFARVKGYRPDKDPADADTIDSVVALLPG